MCSIVFEAEPAEPGSMRRPPRPAGSGLFSRELVGLSMLRGVVVLAAVLGVMLLARLLGLDDGPGRALGFASLVACIIALALASRSLGTPLQGVLRTRNPAFWWVVGVASGLLVLVLGLPALRSLFGFGTVQWAHWLIAPGAGAATVALLLPLRPPTARRPITRNA